MAKIWLVFAKNQWVWILLRVMGMSWKTTQRFMQNTKRAKRKR